MFYYLLDTNIVLLYLSGINSFKSTKPHQNAKQFITFLEDLWLANKGILYIPNIILAETKKYYAEKIIKEEKDIENYHKQIEEVIKAIEYRPIKNNKTQYNLFLNLELNRHHIINFCKICEIERLTPPTKLFKGKKDGFLSFVDMMLLSISMELKYIHKESVFLITNDKRFKEIEEKAPELFPNVLNIFEDEPNMSLLSHV